MKNTEIRKEKISGQEFIQFLVDEVQGELFNKEIETFINPGNFEIKLPRSKTIKNCNFFGGSIQQFVIKDWLKFENCRFKEAEFSFINVSGGSLEFDNDSQFSCKLNFTNLENDFTNICGVHEDDLYIYGGTGILRIGNYIDNPSKFKNIRISHSENFNDIYFVGLEQSGTLTFHKETPKCLDFWEGNYDQIVFQQVEDFSHVTFGNCDRPGIPRIRKLEMKNLNLTGRLNFYDVEIKDIDLSHLKNKSGDIVFRSVKFTGAVQMEDSELENVKFIDTDFHDAQLYFDRSVIDKVTFSSVTWTTKHSVASKLPFSTKEERTKRYKTLTEVYRQLKKNALAESDNIRALKFYRNEMDAYWNRIKLDKTETRWNRFLIRVNKVSSNFGQSYMQPFMWIVFGQLVLCLIIWNIEACKWCVEGTTCSNSFSKGLSEYLSWLVPIYKTPDHWTDYSKIVGVFMRIYNGFFIYHFIKVTRKFGKV